MNVEFFVTSEIIENNYVIKECKMSECNLAINANVNVKEQPNGLYVHGSVMVYTAFLYIALAFSMSYADDEVNTKELSATELTSGLPELIDLPESWEPVVFFGEDSGLVLVTQGVLNNPDTAQALKSKYVYSDNIKYKISEKLCRALYIHTPIYVSQTAVGPRLISAHKTIISGVCDGSTEVFWRWSNQVNFIVQ